MAKQRVASWYWNITAILTPFVLIVTLLWLYYAQEVQSYRTQANRAYADLEASHAELNDFMNERAMKTGEVVGFDIGGWETKRQEVAGTLPPREAPAGTTEERSAPRDKQSVTLQRYLAAESAYYGTAGGTDGWVVDYAAARKWIADYEKKLQEYLAYKSTQGYTVENINIGDGAGLKRPGALDANTRVYVDDPAVVGPALASAQSPTFKPEDRYMQGQSRITLEYVFRRQTQLLRDLITANQQQYGLLYARASGDFKTPDDQTYYIGAQGEVEAGKRFAARMGVVRTDVNRLKDDSLQKLSTISSANRDALSNIDGRAASLERQSAGALARMTTLQDAFETELAQHQADTQKFRDLIRTMPRIKTPIKLEKSDPDGEITYSDFNRGVCHINLGSADGVKQGQRFEVWRVSGRERDRMVGIVEVVRALSPRFSLVTVLELVNETDHIQTTDKLISVLWHDGRFLTVAMHGDFEPPTQAYTKERLKVLLEQAGCRVVDKVQPGVDLVILGSNLFGDEWYREARNDLRFSTTKEEDVRLYVNPR
jgi:hypothetical protein